MTQAAMYEQWSREDLVQRLIEVRGELSALRMANAAILSESELEKVERLVRAQQERLDQ